MSDQSDVLDRIAGTTGLDEGGVDTINDLFSFTVEYQKDAVDGAAANEFNHTFWRNKLSGSVRVEEVEYVPDAALTADNSDFATLALQKGVPGTLVSVAALTTEITGTGDWVADTAEALAITVANQTIAPGEILNFDIAKDGNGVAVPAGVLVVKLKRV